MRIDTKLRNTLTISIKSDILTKRSVLLRVDCDKSGLLFTKRLLKINKNNAYLYARKFLNSIQVCGIVYIYI